jgi:RLL motif-containing protein 1
MFKRKLSALNYPSAESFDADNQTEYRGLVLWLEDQKIRHYKIDDRAGLRQITSPDGDWEKEFQDYLTSLDCPMLNRKEEIIDWLMGIAVRFEYADNRDNYSKHATQYESMNGGDKPKMVHSNPLDNLDFSSPEFISGVNKLADFLHVPKHPDHLITIQAVSSFVNSRLNQAALQDPSSVIPEGQPYDLHAQKDLKMDSSDKDVGEATRILRLLYINDLRKLQTQINEAIVSVQTVTANPKTDTRLGKVGR